MINDITSRLKVEFEKDLFSAALKNLERLDNPLRLNDFSYAMRELIRHIMCRLSPSENILNCSWYNNEDMNKEDFITRKQRAYYAAQGGLDDEYIRNQLGLDVESIHSNLIKAINRLSKFTHIEPKTFGLTSVEVGKVSSEVISAVYDFLIMIEECREKIVEKLWDKIDTVIFNEVSRETILGIDELASHFYIEEVYIECSEIYAIDDKFVYFKVQGEILCELQWGSNSDIRRGDGATAGKSFKFTCNLYSPVSDLDDLELVENSFYVDTKEWREARYGVNELALM